MKQTAQTPVFGIVLTALVLAVILVLLTLAGCDEAGAGDGGRDEPAPGNPSSLGYRPAVTTLTSGTETYRATYTYDGDGKLTQILWEHQDAPGSDWVSAHRMTYTYDTSGVVVSTTMENNDGETSPPTWTSEGTSYPTYNVNGRLTQSIMDYPDASGDDDSRIRVEYADDMPVYLYDGGRTTDSADWIDNARIAISVSADGSTMYWDYQNQNTGTVADPVWESEDDEPRETITFDANGRVSKRISERTEDGWATSLITNEITVTYNDQGWIQSSTEIDYSEDGCTPETPCTSVMTFSFDEETGLPTEVSADGGSGTITWEEGAMNDAFLRGDGMYTLVDGIESGWIFNVIGFGGFF